jgi:hypothetical protein
MIVDSTSHFKDKIFKVRVDGSIKFFKCKVFNNISHFIDVLIEYKLKHGYYLKRYNN